MENTVNVEFTVRVDKSIYQSSPWNTKEDFFEKLVIGHVDSDLNYFSKEHNKMESPEKDNYTGLVQTLKTIKQKIKDSIQYKILNTDENIEEVRIKFNFTYFETPIFKSEDIVKTFIFNKTIKATSFIAKDITRFPDSSKKDLIQSGVKMYNHVAKFMEDAKESLIVQNN